MTTRTFIATATDRRGRQWKETIKIDGDSRLVERVLNNYRAFYGGMAASLRIEEVVAA